MRKRLLIAVLALYSAAHVYLSGIRQPLQNFYGDFLASFPAWRISELLGRLDLYRGTLAEQWALMFTARPLWAYGPVEHLITLPLFAFADLHSAYTAWLFANYAFLLVTLVIAACVFPFRGWQWIAAAAGVLNYGPLYETLTQRNVEIFELMLLFAAFAMMQRGRSMTAGFLMGLAAMTKFLPLIFVPYLVVRRMWRALAGALLAIVPIALATELVLGWRNSSTVVQLQRGSYLDSGLNQSLSGMIFRLLRWTHSSLSPANTSRVAIVIALIGLSWLFLRRRGAEDLEWGTLIAAMVLLPPHNQQYYFLLLLFPYLALLARGIHLPWLAVSYLLVGTPIPLSVLSRIVHTNVFVAYLFAGIPFVGAAILLAICVTGLLGTPPALEGPPRQQCPWKKPSPISPLS